MFNKSLQDKLNTGKMSVFGGEVGEGDISVIVKSGSSGQARVILFTSPLQSRKYFTLGPNYQDSHDLFTISLQNSPILMNSTCLKDNPVSGVF